MMYGALAIDPQNPSLLYVGTYGGLIDKSTNAGENWIEKPNGTAGLGISSISKIYVRPQNSNWIWTNGGNPSYQSTDGGENWSNYIIGGHNVIESSYCLNQPDTLYALTGFSADSLFQINRRRIHQEIILLNQIMVELHGIEFIGRV